MYVCLREKNYSEKTLAVIEKRCPQTETLHTHTNFSWKSKANIQIIKKRK